MRVRSSQIAQKSHNLEIVELERFKEGHPQDLNGGRFVEIGYDGDAFDYRSVDTVIPKTLNPGPECGSRCQCEGQQRLNILRLVIYPGLPHYLPECLREFSGQESQGLVICALAAAGYPVRNPGQSFNRPLLLISDSRHGGLGWNATRGSRQRCGSLGRNGRRRGCRRWCGSLGRSRRRRGCNGRRRGCRRRRGSRGWLERRHRCADRCRISRRRSAGQSRGQYQTGRAHSQEPNVGCAPDATPPYPSHPSPPPAHTLTPTLSTARRRCT